MTNNNINLVWREQVFVFLWMLSGLIAIFLYCWFVNFRTLADKGKSTSIMSGHHEMYTVAAVLLFSASALMFMFHWLRLEQAEVVAELKESSLQAYMKRKDKLNGVVTQLDQDERSTRQQSSQDERAKKVVSATTTVN